MIRDLYDNSIVAYKTGTQQTVNLVLDTIHLAMRQEKKRAAAELQLHSDQGFQYTSQAYFNLTQAYGITPSISRRGNPYDNAMAENFFSILKTECIYRHKPATFSQANEMIDRYIYFYNHAHPVKDWRGAAGTAPLRLKRNLSYQGPFWYCPHKMGQLKRSFQMGSFYLSARRCKDAVYDCSRSRAIVSRAARSKKALTDSPCWSAWALMTAFSPMGTRNLMSSTFSFCHLAIALR